MLFAMSLLLTLLCLASVTYAMACMVTARRFYSSSSPRGIVQSAALPPVTVLIPLCGADFNAYENYASFCRQDYPLFQIVFGVQAPEDPSIPVIERLRADFPHLEIALVIDAAAIGENPKVNNLRNMLGRARYEHLFIVDSDIRVGADYLQSVVPLLLDERVGLVTCLYRAEAAPNVAARMEAMGITAEFAPGVLIAHGLQGMGFAFGATMATTRTRLAQIGGFTAVADYLADDYMLGALMRRAGYEVRLSPYVVETVLSPMNLWGMFKHQVRWARGIRACRPTGHLGALVTHGTTLALLNTAAAGGRASSLLLLGLVLGTRMAAAWFVGVRCLGDRILQQNFWLLPVRDLMSFFVWCASLVGRRVEWRGKSYRIVEDGRIVPE